MNHLGRMKKSTGLENTPQTNLQSYWKHNGMSTGAACPLGDFQVKWLEIILQPSREGAVKRKNSLLDPSAAAAAAKSLQSCLTLCNPIDGSPPGSTIPGILQARTLEWVAISFSSAWKWKVKVKSLSCVRLFATPWTEAYQAPPSLGFSRKEYWSEVPLPTRAF